jgi:hypothetical protein
MAQRTRSSSAEVALQWWPLLQGQAAAGPWPLLVVVHGHGGGAVPAVLQCLLDELAQARGAAVWVQALTAEPVELPPRQKLLLVPLLLTPGSHVRVDVPAIRQRLRGLGHQVMALPFLGAWQPWLQHLRQLGCEAERQVVVHHPLRPGIADRYLHVLSQALGLLTHSAGFRWASGFLIGSSTIMANAAGPVFSIYALVEKMAKETFLGVGARCFLLVNLIKLPLVANLDLVNEQSLKVNLLVLPGLFAGIFIGRKVIQIIPQRGFEILLYAFSTIAGLRLFFF